MNSHGSAATIRLESLSEDHLPHVITACRDWKELSQYGVPYWRPRCTAELRRKIGSMAGPQPATEYNFVIVDETSDLLVGECSLHSIDWRNRCGLVGVCIWNPADRGKGYGRLGVVELAQWAVGFLGMLRLEARIVTDNTASQRLFESLGFQQEGIARKRLLIDGEHKDTHIYARI